VVQRGTPQLAKLTIPQLHRPYLRERLFRTLDGRAKHPVIWVSGPPGSGKTTLLASYIDQRQIPAYWYRVDETDIDLAALFVQLALLTPSRAEEDTLPYFTPDYLHALDQFSRKFFRALYSRLGSKWMLVLDDCHVAAGEAFHRVLDRACRELPPGCSLILISRETRPAGLIHLVAGETLMEINWAQLCLEVEEVRGLLERQSGQEVVTAEELRAFTGGWAAAIVLLALHPEIQNSSLSPMSTFSDSVFAYFAGEVMDRVHPRDQKILVATALLPEMTADMAVALTGTATAGEILRDMYRRNLFVDHKVRSDSFHYHDLFRTFLLFRLEHTVTAPQLTRLTQRAARILRRAGSYSEAVNLFLRAGDWWAAGAVLKRNAARLLHQGQWRTLLDWFDRLPPGVVTADAWLLLWYASAMVVVDVDRASRYASRAYRLFLERGDKAGQIHAIYLQLDMVWISSRSIGRFSKWKPVLEKHLRGARTLPPGELGIRAWNAYLQMAVYGRKGGALINRASAWLIRCNANTDLYGNQRLSTGDMLLAYALYTTNIALGERISDSMATLFENESVSAWGRMFAIKWVGRWELALGRYESALRYFDRGLKLANLCQARSQWMDIGTFRIITFCLMNRDAEARLALDAIPLDAQDNNYIRATHHEAWAFFNAHLGNFRSAVEQQQRGENAWRRFGIPLTVADSTLRTSLWRLMAGDTELAAHGLRQAQRRFAATVARYADAVVEFGLAYAAQFRGKRADALFHLHAGLVAARNPIKAEMLRWVSPTLPTLLNLALECDVDAHTARELIRNLDVSAPANAHDSWPWAVRIETLGQFKVLVDGKPLSVRGRAQYRQYELLKLLVSQMGRGIGTDAAAELLWPDAEGDRAHNSLKVTLHRLRRQLGDEAIRVHNGQISVDSRKCWIDAWTFSEALERDIGTSNLNVKQGAVLMYGGPFLAHDSKPWVFPVRKRLRRIFFNAVGAIGKALEEAGEGLQAMELYSHCQEVEPDSIAIDIHHRS